MSFMEPTEESQRYFRKLPVLSRSVRGIYEDLRQFLTSGIL